MSINRKFLPFIWILLALLCIILDYQLPLTIQFPFLFIFPVLLAAWYNSQWIGIAYAIILPLARLYSVMFKPVPWPFSQSVINTAIRIGVFIIIAVLTSKAARKTESLEKEVKALSGLLPICSSCKKIRNEAQSWVPLEKYISEHSHAIFTHGLCSDCTKKYFPEYTPKN